MRDDGTISPFRANDDHVPRGPDAVTDPVDAVARMLAGDAPADVDLLLDAVLDNARFDLAVDEHGVAVLHPGPAGSAVVLVVTAPAHRDRVPDVTCWRRDTSVAELAPALPPTGVDVLLNPGSPFPLLVTADRLRSAVRCQPEVTEAHVTGDADSGRPKA